MAKRVKKKASKASKPKAMAKFKVVKTGPVIGPEPNWLHDLPADNLVNALTALAGEVYILRERQRSLERELSRHKVLDKDAVENHAPTPEESQADQDDLKRFIQRLWAEIARTREPWANVAPGVEKYFKQPK